MKDLFKSRFEVRIKLAGYLGGALTALLLLMFLPIAAAAPQASPEVRDGVGIQGLVMDSRGKPVGDAVVRLAEAGVPGAKETKSSATGAFFFRRLPRGDYRLTAEKLGLHAVVNVHFEPQSGTLQKVELVIEDAGSSRRDPNGVSPSSMQAMTFADKPNFTVAGVTDWTAVGGHGSDSSLRTSEALASETVTLKPEAPGTAQDGGANANEHGETARKMREALAKDPGSFEANHRLGALYLHGGKYQESIPLLLRAYHAEPTNYGNEYDLALAYEGAGNYAQGREQVRELLKHRNNADLHRLAGELDEKLDDPLAAVREFEQATRLDPSEQNYFEWGSELLLHRAVWQAEEVFHKGAAAYPKSSRMLTGLGTALFGGARYDEAARYLCDASDLNPADPEPYIFMGKIQMAAPNPLPCVEQKLARFVERQPENSLANYLYAMALLKNQERSADKQTLQKAEGLLTKAVTVDPKCADGYLELGILSASQNNFERAIELYRKAIDANPQLGDAHYRLAVAYDRIGESPKAKQEFQLHDQIAKQQAQDVERQRREVKQFMILQPGQPTFPPAQ